MNISNANLDKCGKSVRIRGESILDSGQIRIVLDNLYSTELIVSGTKDYSVKFQLEEYTKNILIASCNCPHASEGNICKHIWASLIYLENKGMKLKLNPNKDTALVHWDWMDEYMTSDVWVDEDFLYEYNAFSKKNYNPVSVSSKPKSIKPKENDWKECLASVSAVTETQLDFGHDEFLAKSLKTREILYAVDLQMSIERRCLVFRTYQREKKKNGEWGKTRNLRIDNREAFLTSIDRKNDEIYLFLSNIFSMNDNRVYYEYGYGYSRSSSSNSIAIEIPELWPMAIKKIASTSRLYLTAGDISDHEIDFDKKITWDDESCWKLKIKVNKSREKDAWVVRGCFYNNKLEKSLDEVQLLIGEVILFHDLSGLYDGKGFIPWIELLTKNKSLTVPANQQDDLIAALFDMPVLPDLDLPKELDWQKKSIIPQAGINIYFNKFTSKKTILAKISYKYNQTNFTPSELDKKYIVDRDNKYLISRDISFENQCHELLKQLGMAPDARFFSWTFDEKDLSQSVLHLVEQGWDVKIEGGRIKRSGAVSGAVKSGIDWFELSAKVDFEGHIVSFPSLLDAIENNKDLIRLDDGTYGVIAKEWLEKYSQILKVGEASGENLKFKRSQVSLLDALLENKPEIKTDEVLTGLREGFSKLRTIRASDEPGSFKGLLREYQKEGLGWLKFLNKFQLGGCLADDMGLGKTVQIIALLVWYYSSKKANKSSIIVVPRSLVCNWKYETSRFSSLQVLDYSGTNREKNIKVFDDYHIILTTYAILRSDISILSKYNFDYAILDEAQAIKNTSSQVSKSAKLVTAKHKVAMSGTPIENHIGELWSLFEFINPGFMDVSKLAQISDLSNQEKSYNNLLSRAISPFVLRRTKDKVLKDLPSKSEQTIYCELESVQKKKYDELRRYYRKSLDKKISEYGIKGSQMHVLEALLRLRQASCHHGLIDSAYSTKHSAKTQLIIDQLKDIISMGHKVLVFSQFTKMLSIVKNFIEKEKINFEYLDGKTKKRQETVERFNSNANCSVFLISLKAGGVGLNLTSADYCFILDPWWNPAVEAQAIDRMHRIGQKNKVFAYRYIAKDTVEEKILALQESKKSLSEGIISANTSLMKGLTKKDLDFLLS